MIARNKALFDSPGSAREFLLSKTDTGHLRRVDRTDIADTGQVLQSTFPDLRCGQDFLDHALSVLASDSLFSALVMRLDHDGRDQAAADGPGQDEALLEAARLLDEACRDQKGIWGALESGLIAGFFPAKKGPQTIDLIHRIQTSLKEKTQNTVTAGVAEYPTITYRKSEILENAIKALDHAAFFGPDSAVAFDSVSLNISGDKLYEKGEIQGAVDELKTALELDPANVNVHNSLGVCFGILNEYEPAIEAFKAAISIEPGEYMALYNLGLVFMLTDKRDQALELFLKADQINGNAYEVAFQTGKLLLDLGDLEKARTYLQRAADLAPEAGAVYRYLGDCHAASGMPREAIAAYRKAIKLNPQDAASMSALGCLFDDQGENSEITMIFCRESVALAPDNALFRYRLGRIYSSQNLLDQALGEFQQARKLGYDAADAIKEIEGRLADEANNEG